jgi:serine/threonine protein kinase
MIPPHEWPDEVIQQYEAIRPVGKGGFASVVLAKHKDTGHKVAMKIVVSTNRQQMGYCNRELDILKEIHHPNIMKLIDHWQPSEYCAVMALSYSPGPTLLQLLRHRGALNFVFARVVIAQLVDAVLYLHSRAVVHRDIKPDNLIISGASLEQDEIWDTTSESDPDYKMLVKKWHLTLIDFGFARALTPEDIKKKPPKEDIAQLDLDASFRQKRKTISNSDPDLSVGSTRSMSSDLNRSRHLMRKMSALGNRAFAAPEITDRIQDQDLSQNDVFHATDTLSNHVSYYGLQVDAYAVGRTMMYCLTGASPNENVNELIDLENQPLLVICRMLGCCRKNEHSVRYRRVSQIPDEPLHLMKGLLLIDPQQRKTLRMARQLPYIDIVLQHFGRPEVKKEIEYLSFVKTHSAEVAHDTHNTEIAN